MTTSTLHRIGFPVAALAFFIAIAGLTGNHGTVAAAPGGPLTISSPAFGNGAPIPVQYTCKGANTSPPLTWSAPLGAALVVDDPDAVNGLYIH